MSLRSFRVQEGETCSSTAGRRHASAPVPPNRSDASSATPSPTGPRVVTRTRGATSSARWRRRPTMRWCITNWAVSSAGAGRPGRRCRTSRPPSGRIPEGRPTGSPSPPPSSKRGGSRMRGSSWSGSGRSAWTRGNPGRRSRPSSIWPWARPWGANPPLRGRRLPRGRGAARMHHRPRRDPRRGDLSRGRRRRPHEPPPARVRPVQHRHLPRPRKRPLLQRSRRPPRHDGRL